jgi:hypothetical protein
VDEPTKGFPSGCLFSDTPHQRELSTWALQAALSSGNFFCKCDVVHYRRAGSRSILQARGGETAKKRIGRLAVAEEIHVVPVPHRLEREVGVALDVLRRELREQDPAIPDSAITVSQASSRGMFGGFGEAALVYIAGAATKAVTERFIVDIVWPKVKPLVESKGEEIFNFLRSLIKK